MFNAIRLRVCPVVLLVAAACGGGDDDGGSSSAAATSCHGLCAAQYKDCSDALADCKLICDAVVPGFDTDCQGKAKSYYDCGAKIEWTCSGLAAQQKDWSQCKAEREAYEPCLKTK